MTKTKFRPKFYYITAIFVLMPAICGLVLSIMPSEVPTQWWIIFSVFAVVFTGFLIYRLVMQTRSLEVDGTILKVSRFFGLIKEGEVDLKKFDGYYLDYVRTGKDGKDVYGYFCLMKKETTVTKLCFNDYDDFDEFLKEAVEPVIPKIVYRKK
ncbi:MAG: hypothetical protein KBT22_07345 [Bacteroidales bacterium]|nr:hypothetical protein [Candidatus Scybalocola fimicaballi]